MYKQQTLKRCVLTASIVLLACPTGIFAQMTDADIEQLKRRAIEENWSFTVGENWATKQPVELLCGAIGITQDLQQTTGGESAGLSLRDVEIDLPEKFDWRDYNIVPECRNQGGCGSCYAFAATGVVESAVLIQTHLRPDYMDISEQWIVSCCPGAWGSELSGGCAGGRHDWAVVHFLRNPLSNNDSCGDDGAVLEQDFPYSGTPWGCGCPYSHRYWISGYETVPSADDIKKAIYLYGPVACWVYASSAAFVGYTGGVFNICEPGTVDHFVILVGWDDNPPDGDPNCPGVWILRNSWWDPADPWGEEGYMRIQYGCNNVGGTSIYVTLGDDFYLPQPGLLSMTADIENNEPNVLPIDPNRDEITYTITYGNPVTDANDPNYLGPLNNVIIVDYLPEEVDINLDAPDFNYNAAEHSYTWQIGTLQPGESNSVTLTVTVNQLAEPMGTIKSFCKIESDRHYAFADVDVNVGCWDPGIIYVDDSAAKGADTGMSWQNAYTTIQKAVARATRDCNCGRQILVAAGTYRLANDETLDFSRPIKLSGTNPYDWNVVSNTIIRGRGGTGYYDKALISMADNPGSRIYGLTIADHDYGLYCTGSHVVIDKCVISGHFLDGIYCGSNADVTITNCRINNNGSSFAHFYGHGISVSDSTIGVERCIVSGSYKNGIKASSSNLELTHSKVRYNNNHGISLTDCANVVLTDNCIHNNARYGTYDSGIYLSGSTATIRNNTIINNLKYGIYREGGTVDVNNCIVCDNPSGNLYGCAATHSFIGGDPCFANPSDPNDYHLGPNSPCIDAGDSNLIDPNETDLDGECRIMDGNGTLRVDIGADEYYWPKADYDKDLIVDFNDYCTLAGAWLTTSEDANLVTDGVIDINDLEQFCNDWLWVAPWSAQYEQMMMAGGSPGLAMDTPPQAPGFMPGVHPTAPAEAEPLTDERIKELIEWTEQLLETDDELKELVGETRIQIILDSLKAELEN